MADRPLTPLPPGPWTAPSAAVYAADGLMVCSLGHAEVVRAYRKRGDGDGAQLMAAAQALASVPALVDALRKAEAVLAQLQDNPDKAKDIIVQGYFAHALVRSRATLAPFADLPVVPHG